MDMESERALKDSILEIQVNAALASHDLGPFDPVDTFKDAGAVVGVAAYFHAKRSIK